MSFIELFLESSRLMIGWVWHLHIIKLPKCILLYNKSMISTALSVSIENHMNESAFRNIWARVMFFKFLKLHERQAVQFKNLENITRDHISRNARAIIRFFIYNILNKIIKRKEENATVTLLWTRNSVIVHRFCFSRNFDNCDEKTSVK